MLKQQARQPDRRTCKGIDRADQKPQILHSGLIIWHYCGCLTRFSTIYSHKAVAMYAPSDISFPPTFAFRLITLPHHLHHHACNCIVACTAYHRFALIKSKAVALLSSAGAVQPEPVLRSSPSLKSSPHSHKIIPQFLSSTWRRSLRNSRA